VKAQPQPADDDVPPAARQRAQSVPRQFGFGLVEQAGHEVFAVELDLERFRAVEREHLPALENQFPQARFPVVEFFELRIHDAPTVARPPRGRHHANAASGFQPPNGLAPLEVKLAPPRRKAAGPARTANRRFLQACFARRDSAMIRT
jgi:hypothetical protein